MRGGAVGVALSVLVVGTPLEAGGGEQPTVVTFEGAKAGGLPPGFRAMSSSDQEAGRWQIGRVGGLAVLSQAEIGRHGYRLAVLEDTRLRDVSVGARLRMGEGDRAAGVAWRVQNVNNYYAARLDFDSREVVLYKFVEGNRIRLAGASGLRLDPDDWHDLQVEHDDNRIRVWLNGVPVASSRDGSLREEGRVGFWMPGDGTAHFARLSYEPLSRRR
jgi:hypothetical protein